MKTITIDKFFDTSSTDISDFFSSKDKKTITTTSGTTATSGTSSTTSTTSTSSITIPTVSSKDNTDITIDKEFRLISGFGTDDTDNQNDDPNPGLIKINLEAKVEKGNSTVSCNYVQDSPLKYYLENTTTFDPEISHYWFINRSEATTDTSGLQLDTELCQADDQYRTYPNILPGYLYISATPELPSDFQFLKNTTTGLNSPSIYIIYDNDYTS